MPRPAADLLFPPSAIASLDTERGEPWKRLVRETLASPPEEAREAAFVLMMARLNNCVSCNADSFRALQGCVLCSRQTLKRFHGPDEQLCNLFADSLAEIARQSGQ